MFQGKRDQAILDLNDSLVVLSDHPGVHLYLGWAYYVSYLRGLEKDPSLAEEAYARLRRALELKPDLTPNPRLFSPRLLEVLRNIREGKL